MSNDYVNFIRYCLLAGESLVPEQAYQTQEDATGGRGQGAATTVGRRVEELASREQVETGDAKQRVGQRDAPLRRGLAAVGTAQGRRYDALRRVQFRSGQRRLDGRRPESPQVTPPESKDGRRMLPDRRFKGSRRRGSSAPGARMSSTKRFRTRSDSDEARPLTAFNAAVTSINVSAHRPAARR